MRFIAPPRFPIRPLLRPAESILSYMARVYTANGHTTGSIELSAAQYQAWLMDECSTDGDVARANEREKSELAADVGHFNFGRRAFRYCPSCIADIGYQLRSIDLPLAAVCPLHLVPLERLAPTNGGRLDRRAIAGLACDGGLTLRIKAKPAVSDPVVAVWEAKAIIALSTSPLPERILGALDRCMPGWLHDLSFWDVDRMLHEISKLNISLGICRSDVPRRALIRWPEVFYDALRSAIARKITRPSPVLDQGHLFQTIPALSRLASDPEVHLEIRRRMADFLDAHALSGDTAWQSRRRLIVNPACASSQYMNTQFVHLEDFSRSFGWRLDSARAVVHALRVPTIRLPDHQLVLEQAVAQKFITAFSGLVPLFEVTAAFGVTELAFLSLLNRTGISSHVVSARATRVGDAKSVEFVQDHAVSAFRQTLLSQCESTSTAGQDRWILISQLPYLGCRMSNRGRESPPGWYRLALIAAVLTAVIDGVVKVQCVSDLPRSWRDLRIDPKSARVAICTRFNPRNLYGKKAPSNT